MGWLVGVRVRAWIRCADARIRCAGGLGVSQSGLVCGGDFNVCNHLSADIKACVGTPQFFFFRIRATATKRAVRIDLAMGFHLHKKLD